MSDSWPGLRIGAPPTHCSSLLPVGQLKTVPIPRGQSGSGLRPPGCFARPVLDVSLEDINNQTLLVLAKTAVPNTP